MIDDRSLPERTAQRILEMIGPNNKYQVNDKLPNELDLANDLKVSRSTLREAIRILTAGGVLEIKRGLGTYISNKPKPDYDVYEEFSSKIANTSDAFELRLIIEPQIISLACHRATDDELKNIISLGKKQIKEMEAGEISIPTDEKFHTSIAAATHNVYITSLLPIILNNIRDNINITHNESNVVQTTLNDTKLIVEFLEKRDSEGAYTAMKMHLIHSYHFVNNV